MFMKVIQPDDSGILEAIFNSVADGILTVDKEYRITFFNHGAEQATGFRAAEAIGKHCFEVLRADICKSDCALKKAIREDQPFIRYPVSITDVNGEKVSISISASPLKDKSGSVIGGIETFRNLALIEELHRNHRYPAADRGKRQHGADRWGKRDRKGPDRESHSQHQPEKRWAHGSG